MSAAEWRWQGIWHSFPFPAWDLSMQPMTQIWIFNQLYALEHVHVVQIWIMHINASKTQLMHENVQTNPEKSQKLTQHSCYSMLTRENFQKQEEAMGIVSAPKVGRSLLKPSCLLWEALVCEKHIPKPAPNRQKNYQDMLMPLHDSMPSFMNFIWVLDLLEFKNKESQCLQPSDGGRVFDIRSHFLHGT